MTFKLDLADFTWEAGDIIDVTFFLPPRDILKAYFMRKHRRKRSKFRAICYHLKQKP